MPLSLSTITNPIQRRDNQYLKILIQAQQSRERAIHLLPHLIIWNLHPSKETQALTDAIFGLHESPGFLRSLFVLLRYYRRAFVKVAQPVNLQQFIKDNEEQGIAQQAHKLRSLLEQKLSSEIYDVTGPRIRPHADFKQAILTDRKISEIITSECGQDDNAVEAMTKKAHDILDEIAAEPKIQWPLTANWILNLFWRSQ